jgi:hypothetical protein
MVHRMVLRELVNVQNLLLLFQRMVLCELGNVQHLLLLSPRRVLLSQRVVLCELVNVQLLLIKPCLLLGLLLWLGLLFLVLLLESLPGLRHLLLLLLRERPLLRELARGVAAATDPLQCLLREIFCL